MEEAIQCAYERSMWFGKIVLLGISCHYTNWVNILRLPSSASLYKIIKPNFVD